MTTSPGAQPPAALLVIGHRGARGHAPENTLASFRKALELGCRWVELDVQWHDGELWVMHDLRLERTTSGHGFLAEHDAATLRALDAGQGERIPTLREVLDLLDGRCGVNVELKTADGTARAVAQLLRDRIARGARPEHFQVSSFHLPELREFRRALPEVPVGVLLAGVPLTLAQAAAELEASVVSLDAEFLEPLLIADAKRRGCHVYAYTINRADELPRLRRLGIDGIFTDYPNRFLGGGSP
ncbi:MAG TPA: glycerophosphodiester phosphodiesterase family protein [Candidatus Binatia bacterium]|nr:glycerophosphodiester phosphodiesterase family protein [Candidatus Binatia bacterium]